MDAGKHFLSEFIECYESCPSLWDNSSPEYISRHTKFIDYNKLLKVMQTYQKDATVSDVKRKINTLRSNFRREMNRIARSEAKGDSPVYVPNLWWFEKFNFLRNLKKFKEGFPNSNTSTASGRSSQAKHEEVYIDDEYSNMLDDEEPEDIEEEGKVEDDVDPVFGPDVKLGDSQYKRQHTEEPYIQPTKIQKRDDNMSMSFNNFPPTPTKAQIPQTLITDGTTIDRDDTIDHLCKAWAGNLRDMTKRQRIIAERAISEIIFQGQVGVLTFDSIPKMPVNAYFATSEMQMVTNSNSSQQVSGSGTMHSNEYSIQQQSHNMANFL